jgi:hypothetical protein
MWLGKKLFLKKLYIWNTMIYLYSVYILKYGNYLVIFGLELSKQPVYSNHKD